MNILLYSVAAAIFFFGLLSAVRVGDIVRIKEAAEAEHNGQFGFVDECKGDGAAVVKLFISKRLDNIKFPLKFVFLMDYFFHYIEFKECNMVVLKETDWKPNNDRLICSNSTVFGLAFKTMCTLKAAQDFTYVNVDHRALKSDEEKIFCVWMNQFFGCSLLEKLPNLRPFNREVLVFLEGVEEDSELEKCVGIIANPLAESSEVMTFSPSTDSDPIDPVAAFKILQLEDKNLKLIRDHEWVSFGTELATISQLNHLRDLVSSLCAEVSEDSKLKLRLIGAWINFKHGMEAVRFVGEAIPLLQDLWVGIGDWGRA